jgi:hypothetical protein
VREESGDAEFLVEDVHVVVQVGIHHVHRHRAGVDRERTEFLRLCQLFGKQRHLVALTREHRLSDRPAHVEVAALDALRFEGRQPVHRHEHLDRRVRRCCYRPNHAHCLYPFELA